MGKMEDMATEISYSLGLEGEITPDVVYVAERVLQVHNEREPQRKAMETAGIARLMRNLRAETQEELWKQGKLMKSVCAWCEKAGKDGFMGYKEGNGVPGQVTHGICEDCAEKVKRGE